MVQHINAIIKDYQERLREMHYVPETSFRRVSQGFSGDANKLFLTFLFSGHAICLQSLRRVPLYLQLFVPGRQRHLATQVCHFPHDHLLYRIIFRLGKF